MSYRFQRYRLTRHINGNTVVVVRRLLGMKSISSEPCTSIVLQLTAGRRLFVELSCSN